MKLPALNAEGGHIPAAAKKNFVQAIWAIFSNELVVLVFCGFIPALHGWLRDCRLFACTICLRVSKL